MAPQKIDLTRENYSNKNIRPTKTSISIHPPKHTIQKITKEMFNFLWDGKPDKIKRSKIIMNYTSGGLKLTDIEIILNSIKGSCVKRLLTENNSMCK